MKRKIVERIRWALPWLLLVSAIVYLALNDFVTATYFIVLYGIILITDQIREISKNISFIWWTLYNHQNVKMEEQDE